MGCMSGQEKRLCRAYRHGEVEVDVNVEVDADV